MLIKTCDKLYRRYLLKYKTTDVNLSGADLWKTNW